MARELRKLWFLSWLLIALLGVSVRIVSADVPDTLNIDAGCVIPASGPWPPCATGEQPSSTSSTNQNGCLIPASGPWPPCATQNNQSSSTPINNQSGCVIPSSGPWPPCARNGNSSASSTNGGTCVIPATGPWPPCATNGSSFAGSVPPPLADIDVIDYVTADYVSNNEVIGVFPVVRFDANLMMTRMRFNQHNLYVMRSRLEGASRGDQAACDQYEDAYEAIKETAIFFVDIPAEWQDLDSRYYVTFLFTLDRTRVAYLSCFDSGYINGQNVSFAYEAIDDTLEVLNPAILEAANKLGQ